MPRIDLLTLRQGTSADWLLANPVLDNGEPGFESDTGGLKIGDGSGTWVELPYLGGADPEMIRDTIGACLAAGSNVSIAVNDGANTITIASTTDPEVVRDTMASALVAGDNITLTVDDSANTITVASAGGGGGGGITTEEAVDAVAAALVAGANVSIVYNDAGNTITVAATGLTPTTRTLTTTAPLTGGGDLSANRTLAVSTATATAEGVVELATTAEATAATDTARAVTPAGLADRVPTSRTVSTTAPLSGGGDLSANRTLSVTAASATATGVVELATSAETITGTDAVRATTPAGVAALLADASVAELIRDTVAAFVVQGANVTITHNDVANTLTFASTGGGGGGGLADGDYGDVTVSGTGTVITIDASTITLAKMANLAQDQVIGRVTASTGVPETFTVTAAARTVLDDVSTAAMLTTLGAQPLDADLTDLALRWATATAAGPANLHFREDTDNGTNEIILIAPASIAADVQVVLPGVAGTLATLAGTETFTNKTLTSPAITTPTGIVKGDVGLGNVDNTSNVTERAAAATLTNKTITAPVLGGTVTGTYTLGGTPTFPAAVVTLTGTQTLTNKTLTAPALTSPTGIVKADVGLGNVDNTSNATERAAVATLTSKTIALGSNTVSGTLAQLNTAVTDADVVSLAGTETLTNKTLTAPVLGGTVTGTYTIGGTPTFPAAVVQLTATQTLTNKTLTSPAITTPTGIVKADVGLGNVDNTSDATKNGATATLANKTLTAPVINVAENAQTGTSYTLVAADASKAVTMTNAASNTVLVPANATVAFPVGTVIEVHQLGAGQTVIGAAGGVTVNSRVGLNLAGQHAGATLWKRATDTWQLNGDTEA